MAAAGPQATTNPSPSPAQAHHWSQPTKQLALPSSVVHMQSERESRGATFRGVGDDQKFNDLSIIVDE